jgi:hypothetical protein
VDETTLDVLDVVSVFVAQSVSSAEHSTMSSSRSVVLVTGSYDQEVRFWEAWSGGSSRVITKTSGDVGVRISFVLWIGVFMNLDVQQVNRLAISPEYAV